MKTAKKRPPCSWTVVNEVEGLPDEGGSPDLRPGRGVRGARGGGALDGRPRPLGAQHARFDAHGCSRGRRPSDIVPLRFPLGRAPLQRVVPHDRLAVRAVVGCARPLRRLLREPGRHRAQAEPALLPDERQVRARATPRRPRDASLESSSPDRVPRACPRPDLAGRSTPSRTRASPPTTACCAPCSTRSARPCTSCSCSPR